MTAVIQVHKVADQAPGQGGAGPHLHPGWLFEPKIVPVETVEELDKLPGMTSDLLIRMLELTTVDSLQTDFDSGTAPDRPMKALGLARTPVAGQSVSSPAHRV